MGGAVIIMIFRASRNTVTSKNGALESRPRSTAARILIQVQFLSLYVAKFNKFPGSLPPEPAPGHTLQAGTGDARNRRRWMEASGNSDQHCGKAAGRPFGKQRTVPDGCGAGAAPRGSSLSWHL